MRSYVILDDIDLSECAALEGHVVWIDEEFGLSDEHTDCAHAILADMAGSRDLA